MNQKKKIVLLVVAVITLMLIIVFLVGRSFGFFKYIKKGEITNVITIKGIEVEVLNPESDALNLENAYPVYDSEGLTYTPFVFTMTNTSSRTLSYSILVENDEDKQADCVLEDNTICPELTTDYIRYSYKKNDGTYTEPRTLSSTDGVLSSGIINGGETITSSIILWISSEAGNEIQNHYFFGKVIITGEQAVTKNLKDTILSENEIIDAEPTLTDSSNNTSDVSGLYKSTATNSGDPTYYFRGNVENNYIDFAGFTWRIVRINEDGTIRLVMQDGINNNAFYAFNSNYDNKNYMYYSNSDTAKPTLEAWYQTNIVNKGYSDSVAIGNYFCEQAKVTNNSSYATNSGANMVVYNSYTPNFKCSIDANGYGIVNANIGLITYDEVVHAGGYYLRKDGNYYLIGSNTWTMSPNGYSGTAAFGWAIGNTGHLNYGYITNLLSFRPVLNLKADTVVVGSGTSSIPYIVQ